MKLYFKIIALLVLVIGSLGFVGPFLISAESTIAVIGGGLYFIMALPFVVYPLVKNIYNNILKRRKIV